MSKPPTSADTAWHAELLRMESHLSAAEGLLLSDTAEASRESFEEYLQSPPWTPTPALGPRVVIPGDRIAYVELGRQTQGTVGFR